MEEGANINLPIKAERDAKIAELKAKTNSLYLRLKANHLEEGVMTREYVELLKELETVIIQTNF